MIQAVGFDLSYQRTAFKTNIDPEGIHPWPLEGLLMGAMAHVRGSSRGRWFIVNRHEYFSFKEGATLELIVFVPAGRDQYEQMLAAVDMFETEIRRVSSAHPIDPTLRTLEVKGPRCEKCGEKAEWLCRTQTSGDAHFCDQHAKEDPHFGASYFLWFQLESATT